MKKIKRPRDRISRKIPRKDYLKHILVRHENEYIKILKLVNKHNITHKRGMGFWSLIRIIFPVIESVAFVIGKQKEEFLKEDLNVPFGHLVWELYRHALMHSDELRYAVYKRKTISWSTDLSTNGDHFVSKEKGTSHTTIYIHIPSLYFALREFLIKEIAKNDTSLISIQVGVHFPTHESKIINELEELYKNY